MSRWIDADALKENCYKKMDELMESISEHLSVEALSILCGFTLIDSAPSIDIVRCKECRYKDMDICPMYRLVVAGVRKADDFCSYGERRE